MFTHFDMSHKGKGKHIGYWTTSRFNDPYHLPWPGDFVDPHWDATERDAVARYLDAQPDVQHWRGCSFCRLGCDMSPVNLRAGLGSTDKSDGIYTWPAGFAHYVRVHNVKPPQEFIDHALGRVRQTKVEYPGEYLPSIFPLPDWVVVGAKARVRNVSGPDAALPKGSMVTVHSFVDGSVNVETVRGDYGYLRLDFDWVFEPAEGSQ